MEKGIIGKKLGMTQVFDEAGNCLPVTLIEAGPCVVIQKKTVETDGYDTVKLGFDDVSAKKLNKPEKGQFDKAQAPYKRVLREFHLDNAAELNVGDVITVDQFVAGEFVDITGVSKGKGYAGAIKRHGFHRGPMTHGSKYHRGQGSMGSASDPSKVFKGKKMAGHMGHEQVTVQNLGVVRVVAEDNILAVKGAVPGTQGRVCAHPQLCQKAQCSVIEGRRRKDAEGRCLRYERRSRRLH